MKNNVIKEKSFAFAVSVARPRRGSISSALDGIKVADAIAEELV